MTLKQLLKEKQIKQSTLAKILDLDQSRISEHICGKRKLPLRYHAPLCNILGITMSELETLFKNNLI